MTVEDNALQLEIETKRFELRAHKLQLAHELLKTIAVIIGAIALFWIVQQPESLINRESSKDAIARERASSHTATVAVHISGKVRGTHGIASFIAA